MRLHVADKKFRWFPNRVIFNIVAAAKKAQVDYLVILDQRQLLGLPDFFKVACSYPVNTRRAVKIQTL
jgi:hypothetical protein